MKTSLKIALVLMAIVTIWSACQFDVMNTVLSACSLPILILAIVHPKLQK